MEKILNEIYIKRVNNQYKSNIIKSAKKSGLDLQKLSLKLGKKENFVSNACNKKTTIVSNNLLHSIAYLLNCDLNELTKIKSP